MRAPIDGRSVPNSRTRLLKMGARKLTDGKAEAKEV